MLIFNSKANLKRRGFRPKFSMKARNTELSQGRFFTEEEMAQATPVAILGSTLLTELFGDDTNAIGKKLWIERKNSYEIIGVFEPKGAEGSIDRDDQVFIPLSNMSSRLVGNNSLSGKAVNGIYVKVDQQDQMKNAEYCKVSIQIWSYIVIHGNMCRQNYRTRQKKQE
ncbi:hypothetical protein O53_1246 [Microcystis aeruginosa TAIHU98]|jgi:putative ABC transport system permease protein|uniref:MacB-like periplasmic core domain-containing protein n=2 Tax=Microcystis aeruginosa TaxID=1126 RepID=L7EED1_MICAE|nr:hypothetical protein O53_1246 [Microcystis aeruginosa TAIHU98]